MQFNRCIPAALLMSQVLVISFPVKAGAQEIQADLHQDVTYCAKQIDYTPVQLLQLNHLKQQHNLSPETRFQDYLKILTPRQQQQLAQCTKVQMKQHHS